MPVNKTKALDWFKLAAQNRNPDAKFELTQEIFMFDAEPYSDFKKGFTLLQELKNEGFPRAYTTLGNLACDGITTEIKENAGDPDYVLAAHFYEHGDDISLLPLANLYAEGLGVEKNTEKANRIYQEILASKNPDLLNIQAFMYEMGIGTNVNTDKALKLYKQAYNTGDFARERYDFLENKKIKDEKKRLL